jgi:trans-2,3-dihydro-3-hydroxyanthranilate isomerase
MIKLINMKKLPFYIIDVFTHDQFGGNQLAVFPNGEDVSESLMQKIAKEINFSETTFVLPPKKKGNDFQLRIFTPNTEIPMAGHPTVGSAFALLKNNLIPSTKESIIFEEGIGDITVTFQKTEESIITIMEQPLPIFGSLFEKDIIAKILSLKQEQILELYPVQVVSCGVPFLFIPVKDLKAIKSIKLRMDLYEKYLVGFVTNSLFVFTPETERSGSTVHSRMFAPNFGITEDPATGGASGALGAYLVQNELAIENKTIISEQGFEIGRPSIIIVNIQSDNKKITSVKVGGECVISGEGNIFIN